MMKRLLISLLLLMCLSSCLHKNTFTSFQYDKELIGIGLADNYEKGNVPTIDLSDLQVGSVAFYSDFFSDVKYIPLEFTPKSKVGEIRKLQITKDGDLLVFDASGKSILRFNNDGKFVNTIGGLGHSKGEYISPTCMVYDVYRNQVIVYDAGKSSLQFYSIDGKFLNVVEIPSFYYEFEILDRDHLILYMNYQMDVPGIDGSYNYVIVDRKGKIVGYHAPYSDNWKGFTMSSNVFTRSEDHVYVHVPGTPLINEFVNDSLKTLYFVDFGKNNQPEEWFESFESYQEKAYSNYPDNVARSVNFYSTGKYLLMNFSWDAQLLHLMVANKDSLDDLRYVRLMDNDIYGQVNGMELKSVSNNKVYFMIEPDQFERMASIPTNTDMTEEKLKTCHNTLSQIDKKFYSARALYQNLIKLNADRKTPSIISFEEKAEMVRLSKNNNPIIQVCTLK